MFFAHSASVKRSATLPASSRFALFERTRDARYIDAARRAGDYLLAIQEKDGTWQRDTYCDRPPPWRGVERKED